MGNATTRRAALEVARRYHDAWSSKNFDEAARYLSPELETDVPLNTYDGRDDFVGALTGFGGLVTHVDLLAEFENGDEALLLYDLPVEHVGVMRVAEDFTVADAVITRIRHVHDTADLRAAGFAAAGGTDGNDG